jgi:uncharacterized protein
MTVVMMCAELHISVNFPVGDLSHFWPHADETLAEMERKNE